MNEYYVYVILNPLKFGEFKYLEHFFNYEPFYVGKGKGKRSIDTLTESKNKFKKNIINKIKAEGLQPIISMLKINLSEKDAFEFENEIIKLIGRRDLNLGSLTNFTDGGEGTSGILQSEETIKKRNSSLLKHRKYFKSEEFKEKMRIIANKRKKDPNYIDYCKNLSEKYSGEGNPMYGKTTSEKQKNSVRIAHEEGKIKLSEKGRKIIVENNKKRKGKKNNKIKKDAIKYNLTDPNGIVYIIFGSVRLQSFCKENKLQFHVLKNCEGIININNVIGNKIYAKNTIEWKIKKN